MDSIQITEKKEEKEQVSGMSYQEMVVLETSKVNSASIASKILQFMQKVRNNSDVRYAKRWTMELLQNTKDCAVEGQKVRVEIIVRDDAVIYKNNSKPFRVKDILSLINQVTSKLEDEETTGKFGTGFMTTMLLSDCVEVRSVLSDRLDDVLLPKKKFRVMIDRSADTPEGIIRSIGNALFQLNQADAAEEYTEYAPDEFNTEFRYELKNSFAREAAVTGVKELIRAAKYIFSFSDAFGELHVDADCGGYKENIVITNEGTEKLADSLERHKVRYGMENKNVLVYHRNHIFLAAPEGEDKQILPMEETDARLYINYPLIGSEGFPFPVVFQCVDLMPDEPRSNIALTDNEDSKDSVVNCKLVVEAVNCYRYFIDDLISMGYGGLENFVRTPVYHRHSEHSQEFVTNNIFAALLSIISSKKIVRCQDGEMRTLKADGLYLPYGETDGVRREIKAVLEDCKGILYPAEPDTWKETLKAYEDVSGIRFVTVKDIVEFLDFKHGALKEGVDEVAWVQKIYDLARYDEKILADIQAGRLAVYPTQWTVKGEDFWDASGHVYLAKRDRISKDPGIMECVKDATELFDSYERSPLELRKHLLHKAFVPRAEENIKGYYTSNLRNYFDTGLRPDQITDMADGTKIEKYVSVVSGLLNYWGNAKAKKELAECGILEDASGKRISEGCFEFFEEGNYRNMMAYLTKSILWRIKAHASLSETLCELEKKGVRMPAVEFVDYVLGWLDEFAPGIRLTGLKIIPNEDGEYCTIEGLSENKIEDTDLYDIAKSLGYSYDKKMVHHEIKNVDPGRVVDDETIGKVLNDFYTNLFEREHESIEGAPQNIQAVSILLFDWMEKNPEKAEEYMKYLAGKNRMRLLNLQVVAGLNEKAKALDALAKKLGYDMDSSEAMEELFAKIDGFANPEELFSDEVLEARRRAERDKENYMDASGDSCIYVGDFPESWRDRSTEELCRWVGLNGEKFAFGYYVKKYEDKGFTAVQKGMTDAVLKDAFGKTVSIRWCDTATRKQPGYDILIEREDGTKQYVEVKSRTASSAYRDIFSLSKEQYCCSRRFGRDYTVLLPLCSFRHGREDAEWTVRHELEGFEGTVFDKVDPANREYYYHVKGM